MPRFVYKYFIKIADSYSQVRQDFEINKSPKGYYKPLDAGAGFTPPPVTLSESRFGRG
jgi:hypothetical protein